MGAVSGEGSKVNSCRVRRDKKLVILGRRALSIYSVIGLGLTMTMGNCFHVADVETKAERLNNSLEVTQTVKCSCRPEAMLVK